MKAKKTASNVVARLTITQNQGSQFIVEVCADAGHTDFFRWYGAQKGKRAKKFLRCEPRKLVRKNGNLKAQDLEDVAEETKSMYADLMQYAAKFGNNPRAWDGAQVVQTKVVILKKRLYNSLLTRPVDQLPGYKPIVQPRTGG